MLLPTKDPSLRRDYEFTFLFLFSEVHFETDVKNLKETIDSLEKQLQAYEAGSVKSTVVISEINKEKEAHEETR